MATKRLRFWALLLLTATIAFADATGSLFLSINQPYSLDTASTVDSGGDIVFTGPSIVFRGQATGYTFATANAAGVTFESLNEAQIAAQHARSPFTNVPITGSNADPKFALGNEVFAVRTNGNHFAKVRIAVVNPESIRIIFQTYGAQGGGPNISLIRNNYSPWANGSPSYGIARGSIFIIQGTNLATETTGPVTLASSGPPGLPLALNGASVAVTVGGRTVRPAFYYALPTQLGLVLPSDTPIGGGTVVVTYNGVASASAPILVVESALGLATIHGKGSGRGIVTDNETGEPIGYLNSAGPGQTIVFWGSGLGATMSANDSLFTESPRSIGGLSQIYLGGVAAPIAYQGESGYPGVNQIVVTVPQNVPLGCSVSVTGVSGKIASNTVTIPIAATAGGECADPLIGTSGSLIQRIEGLRFYNSAIATIGQETAEGTSKSTAAVTLSGRPSSQFSSSTAGITLGSCSVGPEASKQASSLAGGDASVSGPMGTQAMRVLTSSFIPLTGQYASDLPPTFIPPTGGSYLFRLTGGTSTLFPNVGSFQGETRLGSEFVWTNKTAINSVDRSRGLQVTWTGGDPNSFVIIEGGAGGGSTAPYASFACYAPVGEGGINVPSYILGSLPAGTISLTLTNRTGYQMFAAAGLDFGAAVGYRSTMTAAIELR